MPSPEFGLNDQFQALLETQIKLIQSMDIKWETALAISRQLCKKHA